MTVKRITKKARRVYSVRFSEREGKMLEVMADDLGVSVSDIIRMALRERYGKGYERVAKVA